MESSVFYKIINQSNIKQHEKDFVCTFIKKFQNKKEENDYKNKYSNTLKNIFENNHTSKKKMIGNIHESIMILFNNKTSQYEKHILDFEQFHTINMFFNYKRILEVIYPSGKHILVLERKEYSLLDYKNKKIQNNIQEHFFYDIISIQNNKLYHSISDKENEIINEDKYESLIKDKEKTKIILDFSDNSFLYHNLSSWYVFEYGKHFFIEGYTNIKGIKSINRMKLSLDEYQFCKIYNNSFIFKIDIPKNFYSHYKFHLANYKTFHYNKFFRENFLFRKFITNELSLPNSYRSIKDIQFLLKVIHYPAIETTWNHFSLLSDTSYINYKNIFKEDINNKSYNRELFFNKDLKSITYKELQNNSLLYKKKTNQLLKEKVFILNEGDKYHKNKSNYFYYTLFYLFDNVDNLNNFIELLPKAYYEYNVTDLECYVQIPYNDVHAKDFYDFNILSLQDKIIENPKDKENIINQVHEEYDNLKQMNKLDYYDYIRSISSDEIKEFLLQFFTNSHQLEKAIIQFFKQYKDGMKFEEIIKHFYDLIRIIYCIDYKYKTNQYNKKQRNKVNEFYQTKAYSLLSFEQSVYILDGYLQTKELSKKIPPLNISYPSLTKYYFKQPEDGFELKEVGYKMHHCVFSYFKDLRTAKKTKKYVVVLYEQITNIPVVCIELKMNKNGLICTQAKCKYNQSLYTNKKLQKIVTSFLKQNNILNQSNDLNEGY